MRSTLGKRRVRGKEWSTMLKNRRFQERKGNNQADSFKEEKERARGDGWKQSFFMNSSKLEFYYTSIQIRNRKRGVIRVTFRGK